jgi:diacylglycerol kinase family enzyme
MRGRHVDAPEVTLQRVDHLEATFARPVRVHVDGEVLPVPVERLSVRVEAARLRVRGGSTRE